MLSFWKSIADSSSEVQRSSARWFPYPKTEGGGGDRKERQTVYETIVWLQFPLLLENVFSSYFSRASFPQSLVDLLSPLAPLCVISSRIAHPLLVEETHSNQQGQEASVLITMPAASSLICQMVPFREFNLKEIQDNNPVTAAATQAAAEDRTA